MDGCPLSKNPGSGAVSYLYDDNGNLTSRTDARNITTTLSIDSLRRVTSKSYTPKPSNPWICNKLRELSEEEKKAGPFFSLALAIGNALSIVDVTGFEGQIIELCRNRKYGTARQMLVLGPRRFRSSELEEVAEEHVDHIKPLSIGGKGDPSNMRLLLQDDHVTHHEFYHPWR